MAPSNSTEPEIVKADTQHVDESTYQDLKGDRDIVQLRTAQDDLPVRKALVLYKRCAFICMLAAFSASCDGYQGHFNGSIVANKGFIRQFSGGKKALDPKWVSIWGGTSSAGNVVAQIAIAYVNDIFGRRVGLWVTFLLLTGSTFCESFVSNNAGWLFAKFLSGIGVGAMQGTLPMYLSEVAPTQLRGLFTQAYTFWFVIGQLLSSVPLQWYNEHSPYNYRTPIRLQFILIGLLLIIYAVIPESPRWYVQKGKHEKAAKALHRLHGREHVDLEYNLAVIEQTVAEERKLHAAKGSIGLGIFKGINGWRLLIACWPKICQQFGGLSVFNSYATYFFQQAGFNDAFLITVILSCVQIISMIGTMFVVDAWGRRNLVVYGYAITVVADFGMGATGFYNVKGRPPIAALLVFFACLATFSTTSASAVGYAYLAEIPKQDYRAKSASWGLAISNLFSVMFSYCTPLMISGTHAWGVKTGLFFGGTGFICTVVAWFIIPETARRTPAEIDEMFEARVKPRDFKKYVTEVQRIASSNEHRDVIEA